ncbi:MAG TPA: hypothetical protein DEA47_01785, partial [Peptococcaceae bacterium]|nr:hypothetical protein [Peptococcaceae bacterium]
MLTKSLCCSFLTPELAQGISTQSLKTKPDRPKFDVLSQVEAGAHILFAPPGFALRFAKSCQPVLVKSFRKP